MAFLKLKPNPGRKDYWLVLDIHPQWEEYDSLSSDERVIFVGSQELKTRYRVGMWSKEELAGRPDVTHFVQANIASKSAIPTEGAIIATD
jgi:hypothetical protein